MGRAMAAVDEYLIQRGDGLVILFTPPFDKGHLDRIYQRLCSRVRENGGQYACGDLDLNCLLNARRR